jgi:DNA repair protein RecN (Recombination protein N)
MLKSLIIRNYVLIDELDIRFDDGFTVISGETGAGKSIILGALALALGERADTKSIRSGSVKCVIEVAFDISAYDLKDFFAANELEFDPSECIFRRELHISGKSRAFINDSPTSLAVVKELGDKLIDIHSQHQNLMLADSRFQLRVVDLIAHNENILKAYKEVYNSYLDVVCSLLALREKARVSRNEEDFIRFQLNELTAANLRDGEQQELENEMEILSHAEEIKSTLYHITDLLNGEGSNSIVAMLNDALSSLKQIKTCYSKAGGYYERLDSALIDIDDIAHETDVLKDDIEFSPERLEFVNQRLQTLFTLQNKHNVQSISELIDIRDNYARKIKEIDSFDDEISDLEHSQNKLVSILLHSVAVITAKRSKAAEAIEEQLTERMTMLGMPNSKFDIAFEALTKPGPDGKDDITFQFAANRNEPLRPVSQTASGGEISRLMLCIKAMIAGYAAMPSIIFDEIDTGVSGEIADKMADIMHELGSQMQVITITHLPQIASKGKSHFFVYKEDTDKRTFTRLRLLTADERVTEIARMLSGATLTQAAIDNAKALLRIKN